MKITLDIPDGIIAGFFNGVEVTAHGMQLVSYQPAVVGSGTTFWKRSATMFLTRSEPRRTTGTARTWFLTTSRQSSL